MEIGEGQSGRWIDRLRPTGKTALFLTAAGVGLLTGFGNVAYQKLLELARSAFDSGGFHLGVRNRGPGLLLLPLVPASGALLVALLDRVFPGLARGYGFPRFLEAVNLRGAVLRVRATLVHAASSILTIGSGGSAGKEIPIAEIGGAFGSWAGQRLRAGQERRRTLVACGAAAAIGGTFNAPIAGAFFAEEIVLLRSFGLASFTPVVISSGIGTLVARSLEGNRPAFYVPHYILRRPAELVLYAVLGLVIALVAVLFTRSFHGLADAFSRWRVPDVAKPVLGAAATGIIAIALPQVLGNGYESVEQVLTGQITGVVLLALAAGKIFTTGLTLGSGGAGGLFAPCLFIGAALGGAYGTLANAYFPDLTSAPGMYALVGMGGFLAAATHAPMTAIFLIFEMTNEYSAILPIMFAAVIGYTVSRHLLGDSIDGVELARRGIHLQEGREVSVLQSIPVGDIMNPRVEVIPENMPLGGLLRFIPGSRHVTFPVVDRDGKLSGILSLQDFREMTYEEGLDKLVVAKELATKDVVTVCPDESLRDALAKIGARNIEHLPVVSRQDPRQILGMVSRRDIVAAYNKALVERSLTDGEA